MSASAPGNSTFWTVASNSFGACGKKLNGLDRLGLEMDEASLDLVRRRSRLRNPQRLGDEERPADEIVDDAEPLLSLADEMMRSVGRGDVANDIGDCSHPVQVDRNRVVGLDVPLHDDADRLLLSHRSLRSQDRAGAIEGDRQRHPRKQDHAAHGHDDERVRRQRQRLCAAGVLFQGGRSRCISHWKPPIFPE